MKASGVRAHFPFIYLIVRYTPYFYIIFQNALIVLGRQESNENKTNLTEGDIVLFSRFRF